LRDIALRWRRARQDGTEPVVFANAMAVLPRPYPGEALYCRTVLERSEIPGEQIRAALHDDLGLSIAALAFLPWGADPHSASYRAETADGASYFVKLRSGRFHTASVALPRYLHEQGVPHLIAPIPTRSGRLWAELPPYKLIVYPYVAGHDVYNTDLTDEQWLAYGATLRRIHDTALPPELLSAIHEEDYTPRWRDSVRRALQLGPGDIVDDRVAREVHALLHAERGAILNLLDRATRLAQSLQSDPFPFVVCHSDLHAGNFHVTERGDFYLVDWDEPVRAPRERDLMYPGAGLMGKWRSSPEEERLFFAGYGPVAIDRSALAYYRAERIIADIAIYGEELLLSTAGGDDRAQSLRYLASNFAPGGTIELAGAAGERA
jgi:spectinomycin phosphotransferase